MTVLTLVLAQNFVDVTCIFESGSHGRCSGVWGRVSCHGVSEWCVLCFEGHGCVGLCHVCSRTIGFSLVSTSTCFVCTCSCQMSLDARIGELKGEFRAE